MRARPSHPPVTAHSRRSTPTAPSAESIHSGIENRRPEAIAQRKLAEFVRNSSRVVAQAKREAALRGETVQRAGPEGEEMLQGRSAPAQFAGGGPEGEELLRGKFAPVQRKGAESVREPRENKTGLPDNLKSGIESLSGISMDEVKVHYNSAQPAQLNALAYAQGSDIHVAPGQERHLPHEAWHVVQQRQGRVKPTLHTKGGAINNEPALEKDADIMGAKAKCSVCAVIPKKISAGAVGSASAVAQRELNDEERGQVKTLVLEILKKYPPQKYHYLGLGKSPTPVMAFLQAYGETQPDITATNMPLSKFAHRTSSMNRDERRVINGDALNSEQRQRLWHHFDSFTNEDVTEGKDILLIDLVQSGRSLVATQRHLQEYLKERYQGTGATGLMFGLLSTLKCFPSAPTVEVLPLALAEQQVGGQKDIMDSLGLTTKAIMIPGKLKDESLAAGMGRETYKPVAEYPDNFKISDAEKPKSQDIRRDPHGKYSKLKIEFARFIKEDAPLVRTIEGNSSVDQLERKEEEMEHLL